MQSRQDDAEKVAPERRVALQVIERATHADLILMKSWAEGLLEIKARNSSRLQKIRDAIHLTSKSGVAIKVAKMVALRAKKIVWDDSSKVARLGMSGAAVGIAVFGGKSAGVAALGTAIGVPLWVVLGAGAGFAGVLIDEIKRRLAAKADDATYTVIDAVKDQISPE